MTPSSKPDSQPVSQPDLYELATHTEKFVFAMCGFSVFRLKGRDLYVGVVNNEVESIWKNRYQVPINIGYPQLDPLFKNAANIIVQKQLNDIRTVGKYLGIDNLHRVEHLIRQLEIFGIVQLESFFAINPIKSKERLVEIFLEKNQSKKA